MNSNGLKTVLASAGLALALVALPSQATAGEPAHLPGQVVVGLEGGGSRVAELPPRTSIADAAAELRREPGFAPRLRTGSPAPPRRPWIRARRASPAAGPTTSGASEVAPAAFAPPRPGIGCSRPARPAGSGTTIAIVDTGIAAEGAPGFAASPDFLATQFVPGIDLVDDDAAPFDENGHGTHVASTIASQVSVGVATPIPTTWRASPTAPR